MFLLKRKNFRISGYEQIYIDTSQRLQAKLSVLWPSCNLHMLLHSLNKQQSLPFTPERRKTRLHSFKQKPKRNPFSRFLFPELLPLSGAHSPAFPKLFQPFALFLPFPSSGCRPRARTWLWPPVLPDTLPIFAFFFVFTHPIDSMGLCCFRYCRVIKQHVCSVTLPAVYISLLQPRAFWDVE